MKNLSSEEAITALKAGKQIRHESWPKDHWIELDGSVFDQDGCSVRSISAELILNDRWEIFEKGMDFAAALKYMKSGGYARRKGWDKNHYAHILYGKLHDSQHLLLHLDVGSYEANDWVTYNK